MTLVTPPAAKRARRSQEERSRQTQAAILDGARAAFAEAGFGGASIDDILRRAGVTRGALYHHFAGKTELFKAVFEVEEAELSARIARAAAQERDPLASLRRGCGAFLEACLEPTVQRIVLQDARAVLSLEELREAEARHTLALLERGVARVAQQRPTALLARMLLGALSEAAMAIAVSERPRETLRAAREEVDQLMLGLFGA